jgi:hypothetical protein
LAFGANRRKEGAGENISHEGIRIRFRQMKSFTLRQKLLLRQYSVS